MAAGLSIHEKDFNAFSDAAALQLERLYPGADFSGAILTDGDLPPSSLSLPFARLLREGGPWGAGFPEPVFTGNFSVLEQRTVGENHLKLRVRATDQMPGNSPLLDAIAFNQAGVALRGTVQLTYRLDVNEYRGIESAQLIVEQIVSIATN